MIRRLVYLAAATLMAAGLAETADAASWRTLLTADAHLREPSALVGDGGGGALLAWVDFAADRPTIPIDVGGPSALWAAWRAPGGELSAATRLTSPAERPRALAGAGDGWGGVLVAWRDGERPSGDLRVATGSTAAGLGAPVSVRGTGRLPRAPARFSGLVASRPGLALSAGGDAVVAWLARERAGCGYVVRAAVRRPGKRRFGAGRLVSAPCARAWNPRVALDARGVGAIAWDQGPVCMLSSAGCRHAVVVAPVREGKIGPPRVVTRAAAPHPVALAAGPSGPTLAWRAFERQGPNGVLGHVMATSLDAGGRARPPLAISRSIRITDSPRLAVEPDGTVLAAWQSGFPVDGSSAVQVAIRRRGRSFAPAQSLRARGVADGRAAHLAIGLDHDAAAAVLHCSSNLRLVLDIRTARGAMPPSERVGEGDERAQSACGGSATAASRLAVSRDGTVLIAMTDPAGSIALVERPGPLGPAGQ
jgi:hypothetical protein